MPSSSVKVRLELNTVRAMTPATRMTAIRMTAVPISASSIFVMILMICFNRFAS